MECQTSKNKKTARQALRSGLLFTHKGYSGPSVLDLSHHAVMALERKAEQRPPIRVNWTGESMASIASMPWVIEYCSSVDGRWKA